MSEKMEAVKAALAKKREEARLAKKIDEDRRDVPPGIEETEAAPDGAGESGRASQDAASQNREANAAFVKAQSEFEAIAFDKQNPHFRSKYASLTAVLKATLPALNRHGIALTSLTAIEGENIVVQTRLVYGGETFMDAVWPVGKVGTPPQQLGSALTYARRYTLQSILGVAAEEDDDGNAATPAAKAEEEAPF